MADLKKVTFDIYNDLRRQKAKIDNKILRQKVKKIFRSNQNKQEKLCFFSEFEKLIDDKINSLKNDNTRRIYRTIKKHMNNFGNHYNIKIEEMNQENYDLFLNFLIQSISQLIKKDKK